MLITIFKFSNIDDLSKSLTTLIRFCKILTSLCTKKLEIRVFPAADGPTNINNLFIKHTFLIIFIVFDLYIIACFEY